MIDKFNRVDLLGLWLCQINTFSGVIKLAMSEENIILTSTAIT